ncbi:MAG: TetR/AcrR family transcriptional regulator [Cyanobacteria bacterium REEB67]|nr:TetR/AcrR family transcriptional regulator [Cyanobacteria bacterium REEB67]
MTTQSSRKIRKSEQRQQSLVDAATYLFTSKGYAGTTIDDIVEKADVAKVTFYAYFKSKEEIALRIKRECTEEALSYVETLLSKKLNADQMIEELIADIAEWTQENWRLLDVFCALRFSPLLLERDGTATCKPEPMTICLDAILARGQDIGMYRRDIDRLQIAHLMDLAILCEQYQWVHSGREEGKLKAALERCFDFALNGVLARSVSSSTQKNGG